MNRKIIGIFLCIILLTAFLTNAQNISIESVKQKSNESYATLFDDGDVPVWEVGNKWTYKVDNIIINFEEPGFYIYVDGNIDDFALKVDKVTEDFYELSYNADILGSYEFNTDFGDGPINITGELRNTKIKGTITFVKDNLAIKKVQVDISGRLTIKIVKQPYYDLSFMPNIPIPAEIILDIDLEKPYPILEFPLNTSKCWGLPAINFSISGSVESAWLKIANLINNIIRIPGVIPFLAAILKTDPDSLKNMSDILKDILPVIDIEYLLNEYVDIGNIFEIPAVPPILCCLSKDLVKVHAGTFECFNISLFGTNLGNIYYNDTEVGNIVKITGNFQDILPSISNINAELTSHSFK